MILQFKPQHKRKEAKAIIGLLIPKNMYNIEPKKPKERGDFYRKLFNIKNALYFSQNEGNKTETLIIFDAKKEECDDTTKLIFTTTGDLSNAPYSMRVISLAGVLLIEDVASFLEGLKTKEVV